MKPLRTPLIDSLDLRSPAAIELELIRSWVPMIVPPEYDWDWPKFPKRVAVFIETGVYQSWQSLIAETLRNHGILVDDCSTHSGYARMTIRNSTSIWQHVKLSRWQRFLVYFGLMKNPLVSDGSKSFKTSTGKDSIVTGWGIL